MRAFAVTVLCACNGSAAPLRDSSLDIDASTVEVIDIDASLDMMMVDAAPPPVPRPLALATLGSRDAVRVYVATSTSFRKILDLTDPLGWGTSLSWTDYDRDGRDDLVSIFAVPNMPGANEMLIMHSDDTGLTAIGGRMMNPAILVGYDAENDGDGDVYVGIDSADLLFRSNGAELPQYYSWQEMPNGYRENGVATGDMTGDGKPDVVLARGVWGEAISLGTMGAPSPTWSQPASGGIESTDAAMVDFDGDGRLDASFSKMNTASPTIGTVEVYRWSGSSFGLLWSTTTLGPVSQLDWADLDGDGDADLAVCLGTGQLRIYTRSATTLMPHPINADDLPCRRLEWGDYDADGDPDLAVAGSGSGGVTVFNNAGGVLTAVFHEATLTSALAWGRCPIGGTCFPLAPTL